MTKQNNPIRTLQAIAYEIEPIPAQTFDAGHTVVGWLNERLEGYDYLLAHADDGVIWGRVDETGHLKTSHEAFPHVSPPLTRITLQQLRLFGQNHELHLWRTEPGRFQGRVIRDKEPPQEKKADEYRHEKMDNQLDKYWGNCFDEPQILWGSRVQTYSKDEQFTLVVEGQQGLRHAVPQKVASHHFGTRQKPKHPLRLQLRHYLTQDDSGQVRIYLSRLVDVYYTTNEGALNHAPSQS